MSEASSEYEFIVAAEDYQFYLQDSKAETVFRENMHDELMQDLVTVGDRIIAIGTVRPTEVQIIVEVLNDEPEEEDLEDWDQVVEASIDLPSGTMVITNNIEDFELAARVVLQAGTYRMRIFYGMLDEVDDEGFEGEDFYRIMMWPARMDGPMMLKKWSPQINFAP